MVPERYTGYEPMVTVACVNFMPVVPSGSHTPDVDCKEATVRKMELAIGEAAAQGVDIVVFPEEALSGAGSCTPCRLEGGACADHRAFAETVPGPTTERLAVRWPPRSTSTCMWACPNATPTTRTSSTTRSR